MGQELTLNYVLNHVKTLVSGLNHMKTPKNTGLWGIR